MTQPQRIALDTRPWAVILAGGDGVRLRSLTRDLAGDERPKQFCKIIGNETLLQQTARRIRHLIRPERTLVVLSRRHAQYFEPDLTETGVLTQPENRGTAPAILYSLLSIGSRDPGANVALFPSDHYFTSDARFMEHVDCALRAVSERPDLIVLLGIVPDTPEVDYGWIQPGSPVRGVSSDSILRVQRFWEKPAHDVAADLFAQGCLWNSFVLVGAVRGLLGLMRRSVPELCEAFHEAQSALRKPADGDVLRSIYAQIPTVDFSRQVLAECPDSLAVLPVANAGWVDIGRPERVRALMARRPSRSAVA
jgi:mannose-1-phosphate guanylyltransferase